MGAFAQANGKVFGRDDVLRSLLNLAGKCKKAGLVNDYEIVMEAFDTVAREETKKLKK